MKVRSVQIGLLALVVAGCGSMWASGGRPHELYGTWQGKIMIPGAPVPVALRFVDAQKGTMDVRALSAVPIEVVTQADSEQFLAVSRQAGARVSFLGIRDGETISGTYREAGKSYPFWITRGGT
jgi:hypothetical protein